MGQWGEVSAKRPLTKTITVTRTGRVWRNEVGKEVTKRAKPEIGEFLRGAIRNEIGKRPRNAAYIED